MLLPEKLFLLISISSVYVSPLKPPAAARPFFTEAFWVRGYLPGNATLPKIVTIFSGSNGVDSAAPAAVTTPGGQGGGGGAGGGGEAGSIILLYESLTNNGTITKTGGAGGTGAGSGSRVGGNGATGSDGQLTQVVVY